jgi:hypothetical protein
MFSRCTVTPCKILHIHLTWSLSWWTFCATAGIHQIFKLYSECRWNKHGEDASSRKHIVVPYPGFENKLDLYLLKAYRFAVLHQSDKLLTSVILGIEPRAPADLCEGLYLKSPRRLHGALSAADTSIRLHVWWEGRLIPQNGDMLIQRLFMSSRKSGKKSSLAGYFVSEATSMESFQVGIRSWEPPKGMSTDSRWL